jgi:EmrB/QacA subfamily drug resistance transporter
VAQDRAARPGPAGARHKGLALALLLVAQLMVVLDSAIVITALPSIGRSLHFSPSSLQWVVSTYALVFGGFLLLGGRTGDLLGRRRTLMAGLGVFTAASLACGLASSPALLIAARAVEGLGAAFMAPAALSLVMTTFDEGPERNKALGLFGAVSGSGAAIGVLAGGMLTTWLSWGWIFFVNVPAGVLALAAAPRLLQENRADLGHRRLDLPGAATGTGGLSLLVYAVVSTSTHHWASAETLGLLAVAAGLLATFVVIEARSTAPLMPLSFFRNRTASSANLAGLLLGASMFAMFYFLSLYLQQVLHYSAIKTGLAFLIVAGTMIPVSILAQHLVTRIGVRFMLAAGCVLLACGQIPFLFLPVHASFASRLLPGFLIAAVAVGSAFVADFIAATTGVAPRHAGLASGLINATQQIGGAVGIAVTSTVAVAGSTRLLASGHSAAAALTAGFHQAFAVSIGLAAAALLAVALIRRP